MQTSRKFQTLMGQNGIEKKEDRAVGLGTGSGSAVLAAAAAEEGGMAKAAELGEGRGGDDNGEEIQLLAVLRRENSILQP